MEAIANSGFLNPNRRGGRDGGPNRYFLLMLLGRMMEMGLDRIPAVTMVVAAAAIAAALEVLPIFRGSSVGCFTVVSLLRAPSPTLLLLSIKNGLINTLVHKNDYHLYYTVMSWLYKARKEELHRGSEFFVLWVLVAAFGTTLTFIGVSAVVAYSIDPESIGYVADWIDPNNCACGLTGILFALKASYQYGRRNPPPRQPDDAEGDRLLRGGFHGWWWWHDPFFMLPSVLKANVWLEILVVALVASRVSLLWHLSGVIVGVAMVHSNTDDLLQGPANILRQARIAAGVQYPESKRYRQ